MGEQKDKMSKEEVWNVLEFGKALYSGFNGYGFYSPFSQNQNLVNLNNDPLIPTYDKILKALENNPIDAKTLCGYSEFMEVFDTIYGKTLRYYESLLSFDLSITCKNIKDPKKDYQSEEYKKDLKRVYKFLDAFDYKQEFKKVVRNLLIKETCYTWFRDSHEIDTPIDVDDTKIKKDETFALQIMPQNKCSLTGYFNNSQLLYDLDYNYFMNGSVDINLFAPAIKRRYRELFTNSKDEYNPSVQLKNRKGIYANWIQCSPIDGAYAFKMDISNFRQTPPFASLMKSCFKNTDIERLQNDKDLLGARAIIAGTIRLFDNAKNGTQKNQFAIDPNTLGTLMSIVSNSLSKNIDMGALPTEDNRFFQYVDNNKTMVNNAINNSASQGASASSLIYTNEKMMQFEIQQAVETDYNFMRKLYEQFNSFLNFFVNRKTVKYKFNFELDGCARLFDRAERRKALNELFTVGLIPNTSYIASVYGIKPQTFDRMLDESKYSNLDERLHLLMNKNTAKDGNGGDGKEVGNPTKDQNELTDSGAISQDYQ